MLKFNEPNHLVLDPVKAGNLKALGESPFEKLNVAIKLTIKHTSPL